MILKDGQLNKQYFKATKSVEAAENAVKLQDENHAEPTVSALKGVCLRHRGGKLYDLNKAELV